MIANHWYVGLVIAVLVGLNTLFWGLTLKEVGAPEVSLRFLFTLFFNKWFILAMLTGFTVAVLSYWVYGDLGVMLGRFFLSLSILSMMLVGTLVLGERPTLEQWIGVAFIVVGALLLGRF
ncbi:MAG: hypothetical protein ABDH63_06425 [Candidatus Caldarchaeales archaeon]